MKKIYSPAEPFEVLDGTLVSPFLNTKDSKSGLPFDPLDGLSPAAGKLGDVSAAANRTFCNGGNHQFGRSGIRRRL